jgi:two-component system, NarL family, sensor histidine kinase DegS
MKQKLTRLGRWYAAALQKHLQQGPQASFQSARGLGRKAVTLGLETLDVARIHQGALAALEASSRDGIVKRAELFFIETITPIETTHRAAVNANAHLDRVHKKLDLRTTNLAQSNRLLKQGTLARRKAEKALKTSLGKAAKLLDESYRLQTHLQRLTHRILATGEDKRRKISCDLQNEISQILLGINVRLLTLKKQAAAQGLQREVVSTRWLVDKSMKQIKGFARQFGKRP